jgi:hypothetical protein
MSKPRKKTHKKFQTVRKDGISIALIGNPNNKKKNVCFGEAKVPNPYVTFVD